MRHTPPPPVRERSATTAPRPLSDGHRSPRRRAMSQPNRLIQCAVRPPRSPAPGGVSLAASTEATAHVPTIACRPGTQLGAQPARARRRPPRSDALADAAPPLPALAGAVAPGHRRPPLRARLHGLLARDPDPDPADDRQRDRRRRHVAPPPLPRPDPRDRGVPLRRSTSPAATRPPASASPSRRDCAG